jgi:RNase P subunit RPR2
MDTMQNKVKNRVSTQEYRYFCADCGKEVKITLAEIFFMDDRGLVVSKRCQECREVKNKRIAEENK